MNPNSPPTWITTMTLSLCSASIVLGLGSIFIWALNR
jgi:hypothetical protein